MNAELTAEQAANLLGVSSDFVVGLLERNELPFRQVGGQRIILRADVVRYWERFEQQRRTSLAELTALDQELARELDDSEL